MGGLLLGTLLLAAPDARAGTYAWQTTDPSGNTAQSPTYTGATYYGLGGQYGAPGTYHDAPANPGYGAAASMGGGAAACSGTITATLAWQADPSLPSDPPPPPNSVIVTETCTAKAAALSSASGSATSGCDDGLGEPGSVQTGQGVAQWSAGPNRVVTGYYASASAADVRYTAGGGKTITLSVSPSGSSATSGGESSSASVCYTPAASPVTISLIGTTLDAAGNQNILVGQGCTASLSGIPAALLPNAKYSWSVDGTTFQSWNGGTGAIPVAIVPGLGRTDQPSAHWFWTSADTGGDDDFVTCNVTLTPPAGQGSPFTLTVMSDVLLLVPPWQANNIVGAGYITSQSSEIDLYALPTTDLMKQGYSDGSNWKADVSTPNLFAGTGQWQYAQIITPGEYETPEGGTEKQSVQTGMTGLDDSFWYGVDIGLSPYSADGSYQVIGDSPNFEVLDSYTSVRMTSAFNTYLMFLPPAVPSASVPNDVQWVPLAETGWTTSFSASRPGTKHWSNFLPAPNSVGPINLIYDFLAQPTHPQWSKKIDNNVIFP